MEAMSNAMPGTHTNKKKKEESDTVLVKGIALDGDVQPLNVYTINVFDQ